MRLRPVEIQTIKRVEAYPESMLINLLYAIIFYHLIYIYIYIYRGDPASGTIMFVYYSSTVIVFTINNYWLGCHTKNSQYYTIFASNMFVFVPVLLRNFMSIEPAYQTIITHKGKQYIFHYLGLNSKNIAKKKTGIISDNISA